MKKNPFGEVEKKQEATQQKANDAVILSPICKSDIWDAMQECGDKKTVTVSKTSAEIKKQIEDVVRPQLLAELQKAEEEANTLLKECGPAPTREVRCYKIKLDNFPFKEYDWVETNFDPEKSYGDMDIAEDAEAPKAPSVFSQFTPSKKELAEAEDFEEEDFVNYPYDEYEAKQRQLYNEKVRQIVEITVDLKTLDALAQIKDGQSFDLTVNQVIALKF